MQHIQLLALLALLAPVPNNAQGLDSDDPAERVEAVRALADSSDEDREKELLTALKDDDWAVVEAALVALATSQNQKTGDQLAKLALDLPVARLRAAAARSAVAVDAERAFDAFYKKLAKEPELASEALWATAAALDGQVSLKAFDRGLKSKEPYARAAAAGALMRLAGAERGERLADLLEGDDVLVQASALDALIARPDPTLLTQLIEALRAPRLVDVIERRLAEAVRSAAFADEAAGREALTALLPKANAAASANVRARLVRAAGTLLEARSDAPERGAAWRRDPAVLEGIAGAPDGDAAVRRAQAGVLAKLGTAEAARTALANEGDGHVRLILLDALLRLQGVTDDDVKATVVARLADPDERVRERAAVALGVRDLAGVVAPLVGALEDPSWRVAGAAAISLGILHDEGALGALERMSKHGDWRRRGSAIVGLTKLRARAGVPIVLAALSDAEPLVRRTAWEFLLDLSNKDFAIDAQSDWKAWWQEVGEQVRMEVPPAVLARRKELGYTRDPRSLYEGLDVVVFDSRAGGDRIQVVLDFLEIENRMARAGQIADAGLHPDAIYIANCPGEIAPDDAERLEWFVRSGGYLFASCWSLQETIARSIPGFVQRYETGGEVMDDVRCVPARPGSPYLRGVFDFDVRPSYALVGAYLIDVLDPELVEVLIDSPECASRWGAGTMAAWFRAGHGVVLDSVNHFDVQGFERAQGLKKPEQRWAYAVDHLGLTFEELREVKDEKYWKKNNQVAEHVKDLSVLRLITNFVLDQRKRE
ncbi:MAG: HEAT repeat domain-containing protein [Planctomycetota bacterium]